MALPPGRSKTKTRNDARNGPSRRYECADDRGLASLRREVAAPISSSWEGMIGPRIGASGVVRTPTADRVDGRGPTIGAKDKNAQARPDHDHRLRFYASDPRVAGRCP